MPWLLADAAEGKLDVVVHIGDLAYDLQSNNGATGDAFMVQMQPLVANLPYMLCPGEWVLSDRKSCDPRAPRMGRLHCIMGVDRHPTHRWASPIGRYRRLRRGQRCAP